MSLNYGNKKYYFLDFTPIGGATPVTYVYGSNALDGVGFTGTDLTALGITEIATDLSNLPIAGVLSPNFPKPPKVKKLDVTNGDTQTFCATANAGTAIASGNYKKLKRGDSRQPILAAAGKKRQTVYVTVGTNKLAWDMMTSLITKIGADLSGLGITVATAADAPTLIYGQSAPKAAMVSKIFPASVGTGYDYVTVPCGQTNENSLPAGWTITTPRMTLGSYFGL